MILPQPRKDKLHQKGKAFLSTMLLAAVFYCAMLVGSFSLEDTGYKEYRDIDLAGFSSPALEPGFIRMLAGAVDTTSQTTYFEPAESSVVAQILDRLDLSRFASSDTEDFSTTTEIDTLTTPTASDFFRAERLPLSAFGENYDTFDIEGLIDWVRSHPDELPAGVRRLVRYRPTFLSSKSTFMVGQTQYELFLMCKEGVREVHIVLVDGQKSIYLVDRSFQKLNTYLSEGRVRRESEGEIIIRAQQIAAPIETAQEFYTLFLSWWAHAKEAS